jgi:hypothetical protein
VNHCDTYTPPPCDNCRREQHGVMISSRYPGRVCSERCGKRLLMRVNNGMVRQPDDPFAMSAYWQQSEEETRYRLRVRIKQLNHQLRTATGPTETR